MSSGRLGVAAPGANALTVIYTNGTTVAATVNVTACNTGNSVATIRIAASMASSAGAVPLADYVEYGINLDPSETFEHAGIAISPNESIYVQSTTGAVNFRAHGFEGRA
jgi:hypothetical protein